MLTLSAAANDRLLEALDDQAIDSYGLRVAARYLESESRYEFVMGFDDLREGDVEIACDGIVLLVSPASQQALCNIIIDYVAVDEEQMAFVFTPAQASPAPASDLTCNTGGCNKCSGR
jgi:Fe-S cluster assembly iron-binding protein IscA